MMKPTPYMERFQGKLVQIFDVDNDIAGGLEQEAVMKSDLSLSPSFVPFAGAVQMSSGINVDYMMSIYFKSTIETHVYKF